MSYIEFLLAHGGELADGVLVTVLQALCAAALATAIALFVALLRLAPVAPARWLAAGYIEVLRGTSLLVQLYWIFFVLPFFGLSLSKFTAGYVALGMNLGAYGAELVRGAILAVPRGQWEAALALNMAPAQRLWRIILPQALAIGLPAWGNLMIELLKGTALVSLIAVADLMFVAKQINGSTFLSAQAFGTALILYYMLARFLLTPALRQCERLLARRMGRLA